MTVFFDGGALIYLVEGAEPEGTKPAGGVCAQLVNATRKYLKPGAAVSRLSWLECRVRPARESMPPVL